MPISCSDLLMISKSLCAATAAAETDWRTASNRAYYAAYHSLLPMCDLLPASCDEARRAVRVSHGEVIARLAEWLPSGQAAPLQRLKRSAETAVALLRLSRALRERADYRLDAIVTKADAQQQIARSSKILSFAQQVNNELSRVA